LSIKDRLFYAIYKTRILYLYLVTCVLIFCLIWFWKQTIYEPLELKEAYCFSLIEKLEQKRLLLPDLRHSVLSLRNKNDSLKNDFQSCLLRYTPYDSYMQLERILMDLDDAGLEVSAFIPEETIKKDFYEREMISFKVRGDFDKIINFLQLFNSRNMLAKFKRSVILNDEEGLILDSTIALYSVGKE